MPQMLDVFLGDRPVGIITNLENDLNLFTFDREYVEDDNRPTLSLSFYDDSGQLSAPTKTPQTKLLPYFANLLPERALREYLAAKAGVNPVRDFPLLWLLGEDLPGAVIVRHRDGIGEPSADETISHELEEDPKILKFSLAGVQLKFSAVSEASGGLTIPVHGRNGNWILKMPSAVYANVPENEFAMMTFAREVGIEVPEIELVDVASIRNLPSEVRSDLGSALAVKRFDRASGQRIHTEDFAQIFNQYPSQKYENVSYANMLRGIRQNLGDAQAGEFIRRLVFNIGIGNGDMHLKNWSVIYRDGKTPQLSPAYDYVSTIAYIEDDKMALTIARTKNWTDVSYELLERFARRAQVPPGLVRSAAEEMVERMRDTWPRFKDDDPHLPQSVSARIDTHLASVPIFGKRGVHAVAT